MTAAAFLVVSMAGSSLAQGGGGTGGGTVYFDQFGALYSMNSDGSAKTLLAPSGASGVPSRLLHGGARWMLVVRNIAGETYPNGKARRELFAVREDGAGSVQLTNQPDLEMDSGRRWTNADAQVSFVARRWDLPSGTIAEGGVYAADILFNGFGQASGLASQPTTPIVPVPLVTWIDNGPYGPTTYGGDLGPDLWSFDWSPNEAQVVYDRFSSGEVRVAAVGSGVFTTIYVGLARQPVWCPDGSKIAFRSNSLTPKRGIATVTPNGANLRAIANDGTSWSVSSPTWSPAGSHVVYARFNSLGLPLNTYDIYRCTATGTGHHLLTGDINSASAVGWR